MIISRIAELFYGRKNFVFLGEAGSGKTEIALNFARSIVGENAKSVHFFDMDQTKPLFRARDCNEAFDRQEITLHFQDQFLDAPTVVDGVAEYLTAPDAYTLLDIGGGYYGTHMIGQFSELLNAGNTEVLYIINPFRPWSRSTADIDMTVSQILSSCGLNISSLVANPHLMRLTCSCDVLEGLNRIHTLLPAHDIRFVAVSAALSEDVSAATQIPVYPMRIDSWEKQ